MLSCAVSPRCGPPAGECSGSCSYGRDGLTRLSPSPMTSTEARTRVPEVPTFPGRGTPWWRGQAGTNGPRMKHLKWRHGYSWRAAGMTEGTFAETRSAQQPRPRDHRATTDAEALSACKRILVWGGDRRPTEGALPLLEAQQDLLGYLHAVKASLSLDTAVVPPGGTFPTVLAMNSMLTKVHAFISADGLPIYDSRVAGAAASLVEAWRQEEGTAHAPLPAPLPCRKSAGAAAGGAFAPAMERRSSLRCCTTRPVPVRIPKPL